MAEPRPFDKLIPIWRRWVEDRRGIWSHVHVSGLLLWRNDGWACATATLVLAADDACQVPHGVGPMLDRKVCAFRVPIPVAALDKVVDGLGTGEWGPGVIAGVPGAIRLYPPDGKRLEPMGEPRLEAPSAGLDPVQSEARWPRYVVELQGPQIHEWHGQDRYPEFDDLDRRLTGFGHPSLSELAGLFGSFFGGGDHVSSFWNRQTAVRLIAPALCRIEAARWVPEKKRFIASITAADSVPRDRVKVLLYDPQGLGLRSPVAVPSEGQSPVEVVLSEDKPTDRAEVRLLFFDDVLQKERAGQGIVSALGRFSAMDDQADEIADVGPGGWSRGEVIASGGQGKVFVARRNGQTGALKEMLDGQSDSVRLTRLRREISLLRRFKGAPFLVALLDSSSEDAEAPYLVTELAPLGSAEHCKNALKGDVSRVLRLARDIASALRDLHEADVIHRDTKPKNILMFSLDRAVLADLGVAYDVSKTAVTTALDPVDSAWFSPPEYKALGRPTPAYDVFMLGKTIYYLLSGGEKYRDNSFADPAWSLGRIVGDPAGRVLNVLLGKMVAPDPDARMQSMSDVLRALDGATASVFGGPAQPGLCTACGRSQYISAGQLMLTQANLSLNLATGGQVHIGDRRLTLRVCPRCGNCALELADQERRTLVGDAADE